MRLIYIVFMLALMVGCSSTPIDFGVNRVRMTDAMRYKFRVSPTNRYFIAIEGHNSVFSGERCAIDELNAKSQPIEDPYVERDIIQSTDLALSKYYDTYTASSDSDLEALLDKIVKVSNNKTQLMIVMSGECDNKGFIINLVHAGSANVVPPDKKLIAEKIIAHLGLIKGIKAVIINGCQSGCFVEAAKKDTDFNGVVIAACPVGYATTQCEHTGTSAIYAGFLGLYVDDKTTIKNLSNSDISAGFWFENLRHRLSGVGESGLPISYNAVIYFTADYFF